MKIVSQLFFLLLISLSNLFGQSDSELALNKGREAIRLMEEEGDFTGAINLLEAARELDPNNIVYPFEIALAHSSNKDYIKAISILEPLLQHSEVNGLVYQALGNAYDHQGNSDLAIKTYTNGLNRFPDSGPLYLELGNMNLIRGQYNEALSYYELGIKWNPEFPSNYYRAAKLFFDSNEALWGLIYGELFMNIERTTSRTSEISKLIYDTYRGKIQIKGDSTSFDFCQIRIDPRQMNKGRFPFCMVFGQDIMTATFVREINLSTLNEIRVKFIQNYFENQHNRSHPNLLYEYHNQLMKSGHFEAYNYWVLMAGEPTAFKSWSSTNYSKWTEFLKWFADNGLRVDKSKKFFREQY